MDIPDHSQLGAHSLVIGGRQYEVLVLPQGDGSYRVTTAAGTEAVELVEERRQEMGAHVLVTRLRARARLSAGVPLIGLLESWTLSEVTTEAASGGERDRRRHDYW